MGFWTQHGNLELPTLQTPLNLVNGKQSRRPAAGCQSMCYRATVVCTGAVEKRDENNHEESRMARSVPFIDPPSLL